MYWKLVRRNDTRARALADRHYSRKSIGASEFCPPGNNIVLLGIDDNALWCSHRPEPTANLAVPRFDGFDCWDNPYFRNESEHKASDMILEAIAITLYFWGTLIPSDGFHTFVDSRKTTPIMRRGLPVYGWCFQKAGFVLSDARTNKNKLLRYIMSADQLRAIAPLEPYLEPERRYVQAAMF